MLETLPALFQAMAAEMRSVDHPMPMPHFRVLKMLEKGSLTVGELAQTSRVSAPTMSNTITVLANNGWVDRVADPEDRRKAYLQITESGRALVREMEGHVTDLLAARFSELPAEDLTALDAGFDVLRRMSSAQSPAEAAGEATA